MTRLRTNIWLWAILIMMAMTSCSDSMDRTETTATLQPAFVNGVQTVISTRATVSVIGTTPGTTYESDESLNGFGDGITIRAYAVPTQAAAQIDDNRKAGSFRYSSYSWHSSVLATSGLDYNLYAFTPATMPGASNQDFNWGLTDPNENTTFSTDNVALTFNNLDVITDTDPLVSIAAAGKHIYVDNGVEKEVVTPGAPPVTTTLVTPTLTKGTHSIGKVFLSQADDHLNLYKVWMAMDHLYSKATIYFGVDAKYNTIRTIRLKSAKIVIDKSNRTLTGGHSYSFANSRLVLADNAAFGQSANQDLEIDLIRGTTARDILDRDVDYVTLVPPTGAVGNEVYQEFAWFCFLPQSILPKDNQGQYTLHCPDAKLKVEYDVYDKEGNPVRLNQTAENSFALDSFYREDFIDQTPRPGDHFKIKVLVKPTYLYQLTDDDGKIDLQID